MEPTTMFWTAVVACVAGPIVTAISAVFVLWAFVKIGDYAGRISAKRNQEKVEQATANMEKLSKFGSPNFKFMFDDADEE